VKEKLIRWIRQFSDEILLLQVLGALLLFPTLLLAGKTTNYDLLFAAFFGFFLCMKRGIKGCAYAFVLLGLSMVTKHLWIDTNHLWQLGLEGAVGISLFVGTLCAEQGTQALQTQKSQRDLKQQTILHLEEELAAEKKQAALEQMQLREKLVQSQEALEETQKELFSFQMLNDVLRTAAAKLTDEKEIFSEKLLQLERLASQQRLELNEVQQELDRFSNENALAQQNKERLEELNAARFKEAQTHLINETLVRLHAKVSGQKEEIQAELVAVKKELEERKNVPAPLPIEVAAPLPPSHFEQLYRQLKVQFDEKNQILHETRAQLFRADNELQTLQIAIESDALEKDPLPASFRSEIDQLAEEHQILEELVTHLMHSAAESPLKKLKKKADESLEQETLF
jgi:hypothetical protein